MKFATVHIPLMLYVTHLNVDLIGVCHVDQPVILIIDNHHEITELCESHERLHFLWKKEVLDSCICSTVYFYSHLQLLQNASSGVFCIQFIDYVYVDI